MVASMGAATQITATTAGTSVSPLVTSDERGAEFPGNGQDTVWLAFVAMEHGTGTTVVDTTPSGWTKVGEVSGVTSRVSMGLYYRVPTKAETPHNGTSSPTAVADITATFGYSGGGANTDTIGVIVVAVNNVDTTNPIAASATSSGTTTASLQTPSVTPTADGQSIVNFLFVGEDTGTTFGVADATSPVVSASTTAGTDGWIGASVSAGVGVNGVARQVSAGTVFSTLWQQCAIVLNTAPPVEEVAFCELTLGLSGTGTVDLVAPTSTTAEGGELDTASTYIFAIAYGAGSTKGLDTGWTDAGMGNADGSRIQYRLRDGTATDNPTTAFATGGGASRMSGQVCAFKNIDTADPLGAVTAIAGTGTTPTIPQMTVNAGDRVLYVVMRGTDTTNVQTHNMSGADLHGGMNAGSGIGNGRILVYSQLITSGGTSPALTGPTWAASGSWTVYAIVLQVAPAIIPMTAEIVVGDTEVDSLPEPFQGNTFIGPVDIEAGDTAVEVAEVGTFRPRDKPRSAIIWLYGLDGQRKAALR